MHSKPKWYEVYISTSIILSYKIRIIIILFKLNFMNKFNYTKYKALHFNIDKYL